MKIHFAIGVMLAVGLLLGIFAASPAFAESEWLVDGASVPSTAKVHAEVSGTLVFEDLKAGVALECTGSGLEMVWEKSDQLEELSFSSCKTIIGSCGSPLILIADLLWPTEIVLSGGSFKDKFLGGTKGEPGWNLSCFGFVEDTCKGETLEAELENMPAEVPADVLRKFNQGSIFTCTLGGASQGEIKGEMLVTALEGLSLAVS